MVVLSEERLIGEGEEAFRILSPGSPLETWRGEDLVVLGRHDVLPPVRYVGTLVIAGASCSGKTTLAGKLVGSVPHAVAVGKRGRVDISDVEVRLEAKDEEAARLWGRFRERVDGALPLVDDAADPELAALAAEELARGRPLWVVLSLGWFPAEADPGTARSRVADALRRASWYAGSPLDVASERIETVIWVERPAGVGRQRLRGWGRPIF